jgi:hypothetical protein
VTAGLATALVACFATGFVTGLAALFGSGFRAMATGTGFARAGADAFDFAAIFFGLATALAMTSIIRESGGSCAPYTILGGPAQGEGSGFCTLPFYMWSQWSRPSPISPTTIR